MTGNRPWEPGEDISPLQTAFAAAHRIPFLSSPYPEWMYLTGVVIGGIWRGQVPTHEELGVIASVRTAYLDFFLTRQFCAEMEEFAPYDIDGGARGFFFLKKPNGSWAYRRNAHDGGTDFAPHPSVSMTLEGVIEMGMSWVTLSVG